MAAGCDDALLCLGRPMRGTHAHAHSIRYPAPLAARSRPGGARASSTVLMGWPWAGAGWGGELKSGSLLHLGTGGVWGEVRVVLHHTTLDVLRLQSRSLGVAAARESVHRSHSGELGSDSKRFGLGSDMMQPESAAAAGCDETIRTAPWERHPLAHPEYDLLARVPLYLCTVEADPHVPGAFVVAAADADSARVELRPRFGDAASTRKEWAAAVRAARDALPPAVMATSAPPPGFTGTVQYVGWAVVLPDATEAPGVHPGVRTAVAVSDHDVRLLRCAPTSASDLDTQCSLRLPLLSCRLVSPTASRGVVTVCCANGARFTFLSDNARKLQHVVQSRIHHAVRTVGELAFKAYHSGARCVLRLSHNGGITLTRAEPEGLTDEPQVIFACPYPALAAVEPFAKSGSLELVFKEGAHQIQSIRIQVEQLEEVVFFLHSFVLAYANARHSLEQLA
mmetsp:Transcript_25613/g.67122  ORF Transcript_25613/g.67122 Transcript_25613/m.67122 type:complete len:452 (+) Transcript_25613:197-1552(+)